MQLVSDATYLHTLFRKIFILSLSNHGKLSIFEHKPEYRNYGNVLDCNYLILSLLNILWKTRLKCQLVLSCRKSRKFNFNFNLTWSKPRDATANSSQARLNILPQFFWPVVSYKSILNPKSRQGPGLGGLASHGGPVSLLQNCSAPKMERLFF